MTSFPMLAPRTWRPLGAAWTVALVSSLAVLFIGEVMGQAPCNLCWFQRVFVFPLAILLGIAAFRSDRHIIPYGLALAAGGGLVALRSEEHTSELQSLMRISYAVFCLQKKKTNYTTTRRQKT